MKTANDSPANPPAPELWIETVREYVGSIKFGVIQIVVHEGRVVQIERTERVRLDRPPASKQPE